MNANDYQREAARTAMYPPERALEYLTYGLVSEAGEIAGKLKKNIRDSTTLDVNALVAELGDVAWYLSELARYLGVDLSDVLAQNIAKLQDRQQRHVLSGSGDTR